MRSTVSAALFMLFVASCATTSAELVIELRDAPGDTRLVHPPAPGIERGTFDLRRLIVRRSPDAVIVEASFVSPVRPWAVVVAPDEDQRLRYPQTVDVYIDAGPRRGNVEGLEGRGFHVPSPEAWDRALVLSTALRAPHDDAIVALHLSHRGRTLTGVFPPDAIPEGAVGFLVIVAATSLRGDGGVRPVAELEGECATWDDTRCTLIGEGPAVLDATGVVAGGVLSLRYPGTERPRGSAVPVVFHRGGLVTVAPVGPGLAEGALATLLDGVGRPLASAVVQQVVGDTATLRVVGELTVDPRSVIFERAAPAAEGSHPQ